MTEWDNNSGIRERLALLAFCGPIALNPHEWGYNSHRDQWYYCGSGPRVGTVPVRQEGVASLALIESKWGWGRVAAMTFIGHPEATR